jgi:hypothetical protein
MAIIVWGVMPTMVELMPMAAALGLAIVIGTVAFFAVALIIQAFELGEVMTLLKRGRPAGR